MKKKLFFAVLTVTVLAFFSFQKKQEVHIWMIGDSTMASKKSDRIPESGWGTAMASFTRPGVKVHNHAASGRSTLSYIREKRWQRVLDSIQPGDYVIMQFGHNDEKKDTLLHTDPASTFKQNLKKFIDETRSKGGIPVVCSSIVRRHFDGTGKLLDSHGAYIPAAQEIARETNSPYINMESLTRKLVQEAGPEKSKLFYTFIMPDEFPGRKSAVQDSTHLSYFGADVVAGLFVQEVYRQNLPLKSLLKISGGATIQSNIPLKNIGVKASFAMPVIQIPDFSKAEKFLITDFGAIADDKQKTSAAIAAAITKANAAGGGTVVVPKGTWLTGKIHFKSNVNLHLEEGAVLEFSDNPNDYLPAVHTSWEGFECYNYSPLIYAYKCRNVAITGKGEIKARMSQWKKWAGRPSGHMNSLKRLYYMTFENVPVYERNMVNDTANLRPQLIQFNRCDHVLLDGIKITNSPFWTVHLYLTNDVVMRHLNIYAHGHNNDGLDPEMSQNILVENVVFDQGDDAIAVKSGRAPEGWRSCTPSKNIVIRNCFMKNGHQLLAIGSELSGGIENIEVSNCQAADSAKMFHLVFIKTNERMGGYVKNIHVKNVQGGKMDMGVLGIETDVLYQWKNLVPTLVRRLTPIQDVYLSNVKAGNVKFITRILGQKELPVNHVVLKNVSAGKVSGNQAEIAENVTNYITGKSQKK